MRAALVKRVGKDWAITVAEVATPEPGPGEVLVRVHSTTVNRTDLGEIVHPFLQRVIVRSLRRRDIPGMDVAGEIAAVGSGVTRFQPGDRIFGICPLRNNGSQAEYVCLSEDAPIVRLPDSIAFEDAVVCEGAFYASATIDKFAVGEGTNMLVFGASGAIGSAAAQLARIAGADVTVAVLPQHLDMARLLGAHRVVDATGPEFEALGPQFDLVFDSIGKMTASRWRPLLNATGRFATTDAGPGGESLRLMLWSKLTRSGLVSVPVPRRANARPLFGRLAQLMVDGRYRTIVDRTFRLDDIAAAYRFVETGQKAGIVRISIA